MKWGESVQSLTRLSPPLDLPDIHQRWALVWLACLLFAAVLFLLLLLKKDHVKGERFPAPFPRGRTGAGLGVGQEEATAVLTRRLHPSPLTVWLRLLKEDVRAGGECEQAPGGGPPPAGRASGGLTSSLSLRSLPQ